MLINMLKCRFFISSVALVLLVTSLAKLYSATGTAPVLELPEALLPMSNRQMFMCAGLVELITAAYLWLGNSEVIKLVWIAWLGGNFVLYRVASVLFVVGRPCPCLGSMTERIPLKPGTISNILGGIVIYMIFGSCFFLVAHWNRKKSESANARGVTV